MISSNDAMNTIELKDRFIICPNSELNDKDKNYFLKVYRNSKSCKKNFSYLSDINNFLTVKQISKILKDNYLDIEDNIL